MKPMTCICAFSIERAGKVVAAAEPGALVDVAKLPADTRKRLCSAGVLAAEGTPLPEPAAQYQHPLPTAEVA